MPWLKRPRQSFSYVFAPRTCKAVEALKTKTTNNYDDAMRDFWKPANLPEGINIPDGWDFRRACGKDIEARMAAGSNKS